MRRKHKNSWMIGRHLQYMKEHHMCINGDIIGVIVSKAVEKWGNQSCIC